MKHKWLIPIFALSIFLFTPFATFADSYSARTTMAATIATTTCTSSNVKFWTVSNSIPICYTGNGYTGAAISGVEEADFGFNCGWFLGYDSAGAHKIIFANTRIASYQGFNTVTQIDITPCGIASQNTTSSASSLNTIKRSTLASTPAVMPSSTDSPSTISFTCAYYTAKIWYNNGRSLKCFYGNGYTGAGSLSGVYEIDSGYECGWFGGYKNGGFWKDHLGMYSNPSYNFPLFNTLTQLNLSTTSDCPV